MKLEDIKCVFFDVGYTLVNEDEVWKQRCLEQAGTEDSLHRGITDEQIYNEIVQATVAYLPQYRTVVKKLRFLTTSPYRHELEKLYDNTEFVLEALSKKYRLGIIANQTDGLKERLNYWGILEYFSLIVSSWDYQIMKPDERLFQIAIAQAGCEPSEAVMIGDRLDNDIFPAKNVGMKTIWMKQGFGGMQYPISDKYLPDAEAANLGELLKLL